ncbi:E3 ubiquitin-protein ligase rma1h1-like protein [Trifolium pratense]|uniref:E3 ubiquitin-protein ligase RMA n=1 Tax=Trifolium pratense TaxID=57577 RepID=A0A2K3M139_TRIPR|nr:E3 ubiquitin-protein ligase rma1h1-like protein [Trifolium pratense]
MLNRATSGSSRNGSNGFDCNICLENVQEPVVTLCGHLYCRPCIDKWFTTQNDRKSPLQCPVCNAKISKQSLVPLYAGRSQTISTSSKDKSFLPKKGFVVPPLPPRQLGPPSCLADVSKPRGPRREKAPEVPRWDIPVRDPQQDRLERLENMMEQMMLSQRQAHGRLEHGLHVLYKRVQSPSFVEIKSMLPTDIFDVEMIRYYGS